MARAVDIKRAVPEIDGRTIDDIATLADAMPFVLEWSPRSDWFFVNHSLGGGHERLRLFQIVNRSVVERSALFAGAITATSSNMRRVAR